MTEYALVDTINAVVLRYEDRPTRPPNLVGKNWKWLPVERPAPVLTTWQHPGGSSVDIQATKVVVSTAAVDLSKEERDDLIDAERDRRILGGYTFSGTRFQTRQEDRENIAGAAVMALAAMGQGAQPGDYRWHGGASDFQWIAEDNSVHLMDAQTLFAFGASVAMYKAALIFACRAMKDMTTPPEDYTDDQYWPVSTNA